MEANFKQTTTDKEERYSLFLPQFELLISNEKEEVSVLANACAALRLSFKALTVDCGVDVLSFGGTKNGLMMGGVCYCIQ